MPFQAGLRKRLLQGPLSANPESHLIIAIFGPDSIAAETQAGANRWTYSRQASLSKERKEDGKKVSKDREG